MVQCMLTVAAGKRLIARAVAARADIRRALEGGTIVIVAGSTNAYVAEEVLGLIGRAGDFQRRRFLRGLNLPPGRALDPSGRLPDQSAFPGDVVIVKGQWQEGKTIFDVAEGLREGDLVIKGANALDMRARRAGVLVGHPQAGTALPAIQAAVGRRVGLIVPVGLEKRVEGPLEEIACSLNAPGAKGLRFLELPGEVICELDAIGALSGARASLSAAGGLGGAEGCVWLRIEGRKDEEDAAAALAAQVAGEPAFEI